MLSLEKWKNIKHQTPSDSAQILFNLLIECTSLTRLQNFENIDSFYLEVFLMDLMLQLVMVPVLVLAVLQTPYHPLLDKTTSIYYAYLVEKADLFHPTVCIHIQYPNKSV